MKCLKFLHGIAQDCERNIGGVKCIYIAVNNPNPIFDKNLQYITGFKTPQKWYKYNLTKNTCSFTTTLNSDQPSDVKYYTTEITLRLNRMDAVKRQEIVGLAVNEMYVIVEDANDAKWYMGYDNPVYATGGTGTTGVSVGDSNNYTITLTDESIDQPIQLTPGFNLDDEGEYVGITNVLGDSATINFRKVSEGEELPLSNNIFYYSFNGVDWTEGNNTNTSIDLPANGTVYIKGTADTTWANRGSSYNTTYINITSNIIGRFELFGKLLGLFVNNVLTPYNCYKMFAGANVTDARYLSFDGLDLNKNVFGSMFEGCTKLMYGPDLSTLYIAQSDVHAFDSMFKGCTSLVETPELPYGSAQQVFESMFDSCSNLLTAKPIHAESLEAQACSSMFKNCTSLESADIEVTTTLGNGALRYMFEGCSKLNHVRITAVGLAAGISTATINWLNGVASTGTIECPSTLTLKANDTSGVPTGWTRVNI